MIKSASQSSLLNDKKFTSLAAGYVASSDFKLEESILTSSVASVVLDVSSYAAQGYRNLQIRYVAKSTRVDTDDLLVVQFNGATSTYSQHGLWGTGSGVSADNTASSSSIWIGRTTSANAITNSYGTGVADFLDIFSSTKNKTVRCLSGTHRNTTGPFIDFRSGAWYSTATVTSITIKALNGNLVSGSRFSLYGSI
jgi:hypothetical protein